MKISLSIQAEVPSKQEVIDRGISAEGTHLQTEIDVSYAQLVARMGEPNVEADGYKVDAEWLVITPDGEVLTVYNYKTGKNYLGKDGKAVEDITDWHIGGKDEAAAHLLASYLTGNTQ
jgi:hypothetical protein